MKLQETVFIPRSNVTDLFNIFDLLLIIKGGISTIIQDIIGKTISFEELKNIFTYAGLNLFPENDAYCYAEGEFEC